MAIIFGCKVMPDNIDCIIISNPDILFKESDITKLLEGFENEKNAIVSPVIEENGTLNRGWKFQTALTDAMSNINFIGRIFKKKILYDSSHYNIDFSKVDVVSGCFFLIRKDIFEQIGYFDENIFLYYEENIIAKKISNLNMNIVVNNKVRVIHNHSVSINKTYNKINKFKILAKSQRYYHKNYNDAGIIKMAILYVSYIITLCISNILNLFNK